MDIKEELFKRRDKKYGEFQSKLVPGVPVESIIGVRMPEIRIISKNMTEEDIENFTNELPHKYYDENLLHSIILSSFKDYKRTIKKTDKFLPYVDNWAVCDAMSPKIFKKNKEKLIQKIPEWINSEKLYTKRFGIGTLMRNFLDEDFKEEYLNITKIETDEYYLQTMIAWFYAEALIKQWDVALPYIENKVLGREIHAKTIQKAVESRRISPERKELLKSFRL